MQTLIRPSAAIRQNYTYNQREKQLELREKLIEIEELRRAGVSDISARVSSANLRASLKEKTYIK